MFQWRRALPATTQAPWHLADPEPFSARRYVNVDMTFREIVGLHPLPGSLIRQLLLRCAEECLDCAARPIACADVSLSANIRS
jgi:hypothetical protein